MMTQSKCFLNYKKLKCLFGCEVKNNQYTGKILFAFQYSNTIIHYNDYYDFLESHDFKSYVHKIQKLATKSTAHFMYQSYINKDVKFLVKKPTNTSLTPEAIKAITNLLNFRAYYHYLTNLKDTKFNNLNSEQKKIVKTQNKKLKYKIFSKSSKEQSTHVNKRANYAKFIHNAIQHERKWSLSELEALGVVWSVTNEYHMFMVHLILIKVITDHKGNLAMKDKKMNNDRLARYSLKLQDYAMDLSYAPGTSKHIFDADKKINESTRKKKNNWNKSELKKICKTALKCIINDDNVRMVFNGCTANLFVPQALQSECLVATHDSPLT
eukprot:Pgem_evm1s2785